MLPLGKGTRLGRGGMGRTLAQPNKVGGVPDHGVPQERDGLPKSGEKY